MSNLSPAFLSSLSGPWHSKQLFDNSGSICFEKLISSAVILFSKPTKLKSVNTIKLAVLNIELRVFWYVS